VHRQGQLGGIPHIRHITSGKHIGINVFAGANLNTFKFVAPTRFFATAIHLHYRTPELV
jgi:hypothetical protein